MSSAIPLLSRPQLEALRLRQERGEVELAHELPWLDALDLAPAPQATAPSELRVAVFNVERGLCFDGITALLSSHPEIVEADVLLLNEVDWGMARTGNRHVARDLAAALGMGYAFGIEFLELSKGEAAELEAPGENTRSLHGNAILSRFQLHAPRLQRLPRYCSWALGSQPRIGGRMALLAEIESTSGPVTLACVHLENRTTPEGRRSQLRALLDAAMAPRVALGGDLNTATIDGGNDAEILSLPMLLEQQPDRLRRPYRYEPLFDDVQAAGFLVHPFNPDGVSTSVPLGIPDPTYWLKLDWLFAKGGQPRGTEPTATVIPAEWQGRRISDHDVVLADIRFEQGSIVPTCQPGPAQRW